MTMSNNQDESVVRADRWLRDASGTYEIRPTKDGDMPVKLASTYIRVVEVLISIPSKQVDLLLEFQVGAKVITRQIPHEALADERDFLARCPAGFAPTAVPRSFALLRELLVEDIHTATHVAILNSAGWHLYEGKPIFAHAGGIIRSDSVKKIDDAYTDFGTSQLSDIIDVNNFSSEVPILSAGNSSITEVRVELPRSLLHFRLATPTDWKAAQKPVREVLKLLTLADPHVMYLAIASLFATAIQNPRLALFLYGPSGTMKTQISLIFSSFFGADHQERHAASFASTENAIRNRFESASNLAIVVDDYVQLPNTRGGGEAARKAEGLIRSIVNQTGKERSKPDGTLRVSPELKGLMIVTGEQLPDGLDSLRKRSVNLPIDEETFAAATEGERPNQFDHVQALARDGVYAKAMASFLAFSANFLSIFRESVNSPEGNYSDGRLHRRHQDAARWMFHGFRLFLSFARALGVCSEEEANHHEEKMWNAINAWQKRELLAAFHDQPTERFAYLLQEQLLAGRCHLAVEDDDVASFCKDMEISPDMLGYRAIQISRPKSDTESASDKSLGQSEDGIQPEAGRQSKEFEMVTVYRPQGIRIGFIDYAAVTLLPNVALAEANRLASQAGDSELPGSRAFGKILAREGWLVRTDTDRNAYSIKLEGKTIRVWVLPVGRLFDPAVDWGICDVATYEGLTDEEAAEANRVRREEVLTGLRDAIVHSQVRHLLNGSLTPEDRAAIQPDPLPPGNTNADEEARSRRRWTPKNPSQRPHSDDDDPFDLEV